MAGLGGHAARRGPDNPTFPAQVCFPLRHRGTLGTEWSYGSGVTPIFTAQTGVWATRERA